jgi:predicted enzyme related to lactoylglutathione lyase
MTTKDHTLNWFEISVLDIERAKKFYETIFDIQMRQEEMMDMVTIYFPMNEGSGKVSGALVKSPMHKPSADGVKIYLNANPDLATVLAKIEPAGGQITVPKTPIAKYGFMAFFTDTEGNLLALHSNH